jgi:predicted dehydrogenase
MTRRDFLHTATALSLTAPALSADTPGRRIRAGFLGVEYSHAAEKARILSSSPDYELIGVCPENETLRATYASRGVPILSRDEVLEQSELVVVESAVPTHAEHARLALEAGRHVHLEKPPAINLADFDAVLKLAREKQLLLQVGYMWRYNPGLNAALEAAHKGWLGQVFLVRATLNNTLDARRRSEWEQFKGGVLFELGSHLVDAIVRLHGRPERVTSFLNTHGSLTDTFADNNLAVFEYPTATALITSSSLQPNAFAHRTFAIMGTKGTAIVRPLEPPQLQLDLAEAAGPYSRGLQTVPQPDYRRYEGEFAELARCLRDDRPLPVSLDVERDIHETLLRACKAV